MTTETWTIRVCKHGHAEACGSAHCQTADAFSPVEVVSTRMVAEVLEETLPYLVFPPPVGGARVAARVRSLMADIRVLGADSRG